MPLVLTKEGDTFILSDGAIILGKGMDVKACRADCLKNAKMSAEQIASVFVGKTTGKGAKAVVSLGFGIPITAETLTVEIKETEKPKPTKGKAETLKAPLKKDIPSEFMPGKEEPEIEDTWKAWATIPSVTLLLPCGGDGAKRMQASGKFDCFKTCVLGEIEGCLELQALARAGVPAIKEGEVTHPANTPEALFAVARKRQREHENALKVLTGKPTKEKTAK